MTPQYSSPTRLRDYIAFLLPWAHGHQLKAIGDFVAAIIEQQTACQAQLARYFGKQEAAVKRLSRLLEVITIYGILCLQYKEAPRNGHFTVHRRAGSPHGVLGFHEFDARRVSAAGPVL